MHYTYRDPIGQRAPANLSRSNPPFAYHEYDMPFTGKLARGFMIVAQSVKGQTWSRDTPQDQLRFLWNPASIELSYGAEPGEFFLDDQSAAEQGVDMNGVARGSDRSISFDVLFDRMIEVARGDKKGVQVDVEQLEHMLGILEESQPPVTQPVTVFFGGAGAPSFKGWLSGAQVRYSQFSADMVPIRAEMGFVLERRYDPGMASAAPGGIGDPLPSATYDPSRYTPGYVPPYTPRPTPVNPGPV